MIPPSELEIKAFNIVTGPEGFEPSTNCSAGSHSIQTELWALIFGRLFSINLFVIFSFIKKI
jgi:hypothetical protein